MRSFFVHIGLVVLALVASACPRPGCPTTPHTDAARALRMHRSLHRTIAGLRGEARVDQRGGEQGRVRGTVLLLVQRPDRVRFDVMTQFGPAAVLTSDGQDFQLLDLRESRFLHGASTPENIARLLGVAMRGDELSRLILGDTPRLEGTPEIQCTGDGYLIEIQDAEGYRQEIVLTAREADLQAPPEEQHLRLRRTEIFDPLGETRWRVTFEDYQVVPDPADPEGRGVALPFTVHFEDPVRGEDTRVRFKEIELMREAPDASVFTQEAPGGVTIEAL